MQNKTGNNPPSIKWSPSSRLGATREIDALVYELYGLTNDEIAIVEGRS